MYKTIPQCINLETLGALSPLIIPLALIDVMIFPYTDHRGQCVVLICYFRRFTNPLYFQKTWRMLLENRY